MDRSNPSPPAALDAQKIIEKASNPRPLTTEIVRTWSDEELAYGSVPGNQTPFNHSIIDREVRRRDAWNAPAAKSYRVSVRSFWLSVAALLVAIAAVIVNYLKLQG